MKTQPSRLKAFLESRFSPFSHPNYRLFFTMQTLSQIGTWSHELARSWLVIEMMGKAGSLGLLMLASAIPSLLLVLRGGILVDRSDVRRLMMITKTLLGFSALTLALFVENTQITLWHLMVFAAIEGGVAGFDAPAYQALTVRLVPSQDFQQALALNSTNFHAARMTGPLVAGLIMAWHGPSAVFLFDAFTYFTLAFGLRKLRLRQIPQATSFTRATSWRALMDGFRYFMKDLRLRYLLLQLLLTNCLLFPVLVVIFRTYIQQKFQLTAEEFGYVFMIPALGSTFGALGFAALKPSAPLRALGYGIPLAVALILLIPQFQSVMATAITMGVAGFFTYLTFSSLTVSLQLYVQEEYRGRISSLIAMSFLSIGPLMSFPLGAYADWIGFPRAIYSTTVAYFIGSALLAWKFWHKGSPRANTSKPRYKVS